MISTVKDTMQSVMLMSNKLAVGQARPLKSAVPARAKPAALKRQAAGRVRAEKVGNFARQRASCDISTVMSTYLCSYILDRTSSGEICSYLLAAGCFEKFVKGLVGDLNVCCAYLAVGLYYTTLHVCITGEWHRFEGARARDCAAGRAPQGSGVLCVLQKLFVHA